MEFNATFIGQIIVFAILIWFFAKSSRRSVEGDDDGRRRSPKAFLLPTVARKSLDGPRCVLKSDPRGA